MRGALVCKAANDQIDDDVYMENVVMACLKKQLAKQRKGFRIMNLSSAHIGYNGDDIVRNLVTISFTFDKYKKPRFIK